jgi:hypothetical protein
MKNLIEQSKNILLNKEDELSINEGARVIGDDVSTLPDAVKKLLINVADSQVRFMKPKGASQKVSLRSSDFSFGKSDIALLYKAGLSDIVCEATGGSNVIFYMTFN